MTIKRTGQGMKGILKRLQDSTVTVGIHKDAGEYPSGEKVFEVGMYNEYGTDKIPERPFIRSTVRRNRAEYKKAFEAAYIEALRGGMNLRASAMHIGARARNDIKQTIEDIKSPPNAPATIARKGFDDPLIDTRRLYKAIKWKYYYG